MHKAKKPKMGRPRLPKGQVQDKKIIVRVTPVFYETLSAAAKKASKRLSDYVRDTLTEKLNQER